MGWTDSGAGRSVGQADRADVGRIQRPHVLSLSDEQAVAVVFDDGDRDGGWPGIVETNRRADDHLHRHPLPDRRTHDRREIRIPTQRPGNRQQPLTQAPADANPAVQCAVLVEREQRLRLLFEPGRETGGRASVEERRPHSLFRGHLARARRGVHNQRQADGNRWSVRGPEGTLGWSQFREPPAVGVETDASQRRPDVDAGEEVERTEVAGKIGELVSDEQPLFAGPHVDHGGRARESVHRHDMHQRASCPAGLVELAACILDSSRLVLGAPGASAIRLRSLPEACGCHAADGSMQSRRVGRRGVQVK